MLFVIVIMSFFLLLMSFLLIRRTYNGILMTIDNIVILLFMTVWGAVFPLWYLYASNNRTTKYLSYIADYTATDIILYYFCVLVFLYVFIFSFRICVKKNKPFGVELVTLESSDKFFLVTVILFILGVVANHLYLLAYDGFTGYLYYSGYIRSGLTTLVYNKWSFLIVFRDCIILSSYLFFSQIKRNTKKDKVCLILFIISFVLSLLVLYSNRGRISLCIYLFVFLFFVLFRKLEIKILNLKSMLFIFAIGIVAVLVLLLISNILSRSLLENPLANLINETSFIFANFKILLNNMEFEDCRWFIDIVSYPIYLLPSSIWREFLPNTASDIITIFIYGAKKGEANIYGEAPIDAISIGYLQCGIIGIVFFALFFGIIVAKLFNYINSIESGNVKLILIVYVLIDLIIRSIFYADSYNIIQRSFSLIIFILIHFFVELFFEQKSM